MSEWNEAIEAAAETVEKCDQTFESPFRYRRDFAQSIRALSRAENQPAGLSQDLPVTA